MCWSASAAAAVAGLPRLTDTAWPLSRVYWPLSLNWTLNFLPPLTSSVFFSLSVCLWPTASVIHCNNSLLLLQKVLPPLLLQCLWLGLSEQQLFIRLHCPALCPLCRSGQVSGTREERERGWHWLVQVHWGTGTLTRGGGKKVKPSFHLDSPKGSGQSTGHLFNFFKIVKSLGQVCVLFKTTLTIREDVLWRLLNVPDAVRGSEDWLSHPRGHYTEVCGHQYLWPNSSNHNLSFHQYITSKVILLKSIIIISSSFKRLKVSRKASSFRGSTLWQQQQKQVLTSVISTKSIQFFVSRFFLSQIALFSKTFFVYFSFTRQHFQMSCLFSLL